MSKIRMALLKDFTVVGIAWLDKTGVGQAIRINIPRRKQAIIKKAVAEGLEFPTAKAIPKNNGPIAQTDSGVVYKKPSLILPADLAGQPAPKPFRPRQAGEIRLDD